MKTVRYWLPSWAPMAAITLFGRVFAKPDIQPWDLEHELVHVRQQAADGFKFYLRYLFLPRARALYEAEAYAVQARAGCNVEELGGLIASWLYLWPCSRARAAELIRGFL